VTSREFRARLLKRARKADLAIPSPLVAPLEIYFRLLARWNEKINLTALPVDELTDQAVDRLFVEPLAAARFVPERPIEWFDLGSGGGSPALPLKLARPAARLTMVESKTRKAAFLREAVRTLALEDVTIENARFEVVALRADHRRAVDLLTVRAVKIDKSVIRAAAALLASHGRLMLFSGRPRSGGEPTQPFQFVQTVRLAASDASMLAILERVDVSDQIVPRGTPP